ncbi:DUF2235 domain-containing protein [Marinomonas epiphytica]
MANIIVCADGTWNKPEEDLQKDFPTNVLKVARAICPERASIKQHVFYDWGVGSYYHMISGGALGKGIHKNIQDAYRYIVQNYQDGDRIFLFGFSRGAYTVRALSGLIYNCGIPHRDHAEQIANAWKIYKSSLSRNAPNGASAQNFRNQYCHPSRDVHFIGVWDTVGALGIPFSIMGLFNREDEFYDTKMGPNIRIARHALAIDEKRADFEPTIWQPRPGIDLKQVWFAGVHADIGGSYPPDKGTGYAIADTSLAWMIREAIIAGLHIENHLKQHLTDGALGQKHESRGFPYRYKKALHRPLCPSNVPVRIHHTVKERYLRDIQYRPPQLQKIVEKQGWDSLTIED